MKGRPSTISKSHLSEFINLCLSGLTRKQAADKLGFSLAGIRVSLKKHNLNAPRKLLVDRIRLRIDEIRGSGKTQAWWAKEFGVSQVSIHKAFKQLKISSAQQGQIKPGPTTDYVKRIAEYRQILVYLQEHGGYIPHVIKALGLKTLPQGVRNFAREIGMDPRHWRFAWREYGLWLTLPGHWVRLPPSNYSVPAICQGCGTRSELNLCNAKSGKTKGCINCAQAARCFDKVRDCQTGEIYSSIMGWSKAIGLLKQYQKYRLLLQQQYSVEIEGNVYELVTD